MIRDVADRNVMGRYVTAVRRELEAGAVDDDAAKAARTIRPDAEAEPKDEILRHLPDDGAGPDEDGPFLAHDPIVSLLQTSIDERLRDDAGVEPEDPEGDGFFERVLDRAQDLLHPERFGPDDPKWITRIARATLARLAEGNHPFNPEPAEYEIADDARLVVVGDWGTGLERAQHVARHMAEAITEAHDAGREVHVVHLGDVYYSGVPDEYDRHVLADGWWPVTAAQSGNGVTSWSLVGNHDMYSGGWGFFDHLLADPRFARQRSPDGQPTSFFRLKSPSWTIAGLDTSWNSDVISRGNTGVLEDPQAGAAAAVGRRARRRQAHAPQPPPVRHDRRPARHRRGPPREGRAAGGLAAHHGVALGPRAPLHRLRDRRDRRTCAASATAACRSRAARRGTCSRPRRSGRSPAATRPTASAGGASGSRSSTSRATGSTSATATTRAPRPTAS